MKEMKENITDDYKYKGQEVLYWNIDKILCEFMLLLSVRMKEDE